MKNICLKLVFKGFTPPHQSTLIRGKSKILSNGYNAKYRLAGDLEFFCRLTKTNQLSIVNFPIDIVHISTGGISDRENFLRIKEVLRCYAKYFKFYFFFPFILRYLNRLNQIK